MTYIATNRDAAHAFFYTEADRVTFAKSLNMTFAGPLFYSYSTVIAARAEGKDGRPVYLISGNGMSRTTAKRLCYLRSACPCDYIRVPFEWGDDFYKPESNSNMLNLLADRFKKMLRRAADARLTRAENRRALIDCYKDAKKFSERVFTLDFLSDFSDAYATAAEIEEGGKEKCAELIKAAAKRQKRPAPRLSKSTDIWAPLCALIPKEMIRRAAFSTRRTNSPSSGVIKMAIIVPRNAFA